jgi:hypothetical protein
MTDSNLQIIVIETRPADTVLTMSVMRAIRSEPTIDSGNSLIEILYSSYGTAPDQQLFQLIQNGRPTILVMLGSVDLGLLALARRVTPTATVIGCLSEAGRAQFDKCSAGMERLNLKCNHVLRVEAAWGTGEACQTLIRTIREVAGANNVPSLSKTTPVYA